MNPWQLFALAVVVHTDVAHLVLRCSEVVQDILDIVVLRHLMVLRHRSQVGLVVGLAAFPFGIRVDEIEVQLARLDEFNRADSASFHVDAVRGAALLVLSSRDNAGAVCLRI